MSPGLTETLFALGVGDRIVGVTRFCMYPVEAQEIPRIGGYLDPNWEAIIALRPDLVVLMESHRQAEERLTSFGLRSMNIDQHDIPSILESFEILGRVCGVKKNGENLRQSVEEKLSRTQMIVSSLPRPQVLVSIGREAGSGRIGSVWAAGAGTFFDDILKMAGGENALGKTHVGAYPEISREGLLHLDPDIILDVFPDLEERGLSVEAVVEDWADLEALTAVRQMRVHVLSQPFMTIPGPRVGEVVETVAKTLHPEVDW